jgi:hypothetical protein
MEYSAGAFWRFGEFSVATHGARMDMILFRQQKK